MPNSVKYWNAYIVLYVYCYLNCLLILPIIYKRIRLLWIYYTEVLKKNKCKIVILTLFFYDLYKKCIIENIKYSFVFMYTQEKGSL